MSDQHPIEQQSLESLTERAVESLNIWLPKLKGWIDKVRPEDGTPGRFRWALETTREANRKMAAWRIQRIFEVFGQEDGGLSYSRKHCCTSWIGFDMAPAIRQGDSMGPSVIVPAVTVCVDLLGLHGVTPWPGDWRSDPSGRESGELREEILRRLRL